MSSEITAESRLQAARLPAVSGAIRQLTAELRSDCSRVRTLLAQAPQLRDSDPDFLAESLLILNDNLDAYQGLVRLLLQHQFDTTRCHHALLEFETLLRLYADRVENLLGAASDLGRA